VPIPGETIETGGIRDDPPGIGICIKRPTRNMLWQQLTFLGEKKNSHNIYS